MTTSSSHPVPIGSHLKREAKGLLEKGDDGVAVAELQRALDAAGAKLKVDGAFGDQTRAAVSAFQRKAHIKVDGIFGPQTLAALGKVKVPDAAPPKPPARPGPKPPTAGSKPIDPHHSKQWNMYARMVKEAGGKLPTKGQPTVLGIRKGNGASSHYGDEFVVLTAGGKVKKFTGSTRPGQSSSSASPDVNGDGQGDVAEIRPGNYYAVPNGIHSGKPSYSVRVAGNHGSDHVAAYRDLNHDGFYSAAEKEWSRKHGITASEILFHVGGSSPSSIGCQNLTPGNVDAFIRSVGGSRGAFNYTLVNR
ncbi:MAG: peptidoglycan-binding protein [Archangiaceae bacterium]|nr:peptidoglycan-binding protein [Archangiaceae bacterium]